MRDEALDNFWHELEFLVARTRISIKWDAAMARRLMEERHQHLDALIAEAESLHQALCNARLSGVFHIRPPRPWPRSA